MRVGSVDMMFENYTPPLPLPTPCPRCYAVLNSPPPKDARRVPAAAGDGAYRPCTDGVPTGYWSKMEGLSSASEVERSWRRPLMG